MADFSDILAVRPQQQRVNSAATPHAVTGTVIKVTIVAESFNDPDTTETLFCGTFEVDGIDFDGPPDVATVKAVSVPMQTPIRRESRTRAWENVNLSKIGTDIAHEGGMSLQFLIKNDPRLDRVDQRQEASLPFFKKLCMMFGATVKVSNNTVIVYDELEFEARPSVVTFKKGDGKLIGYNFTLDSSNVASSAEITYKDPRTNMLIAETFEPDDAPATGVVHRVTERPPDIIREELALRPFAAFAATTQRPADDFADIRADARGTARRMAQCGLRARNKSEWTCDLQVVGDVKHVEGMTFEVEGFGVYDGKYLAESVGYDIGSGFTNEIKGHKVLGY